MLFLPFSIWPVARHPIRKEYRTVPYHYAPGICVNRTGHMHMAMILDIGLLHFLCRQQQAKGSAFTQLAQGTDIAFVVGHHPLYDCESNAGAFVF